MLRIHWLSFITERITNLMRIKEKNKKIKILLVIYGDVHFGGVSVLINNLLAKMDRSRLDITLYAFGNVADEGCYRFYEENGVKIVLGEHDRYRRKLIAWDLLRIIAKGKFDVIHCNTGGLELTFISMAIARVFGVKKRIAHSHGSKRSSVPYSRREQFYQRANDRLANIQLSCSVEAAQHLFGHSDVRLLYNGIDLNKFTFSSDLRKKARSSMELDGKFVIGTVGRLDYIKNQKFIFDIVKILKEKSEVRALIVGSGSFKDELVKYSEELEIEESIIFIDANDRIEYYLCAMDAFVFPSLSEGLGISAIEAQAMDLPVWSSTNVPRKAAVTEKAFFMDLEDGAGKWADDIFEYCQCHDLENRYDRSIDIRKKGYDICDSAKVLHDIYLDRK